MKLKDETIKYSILIAGEACTVNEIEMLLKSGKKVILFHSSQEKAEKYESLLPYEKAGFFELYENKNEVILTVVDGVNASNQMEQLKSLEEGDNRFNLEQYLIEHADSSHNLIIEAGAGTGKTHVMINRIMYLMHVDEDFDFSRVAMITFTNKATDNMRHRLVKVLNLKYKLTRDVAYLTKIEESAQINISTIHSFFKKIIVEIGPILGYGTSVSLRSFINEKKEILLNILNDYYGGNSKVENVLGLPVHYIEELALNYWDKLDNSGLSEKEIANLQWGTTNDDKSKKIQQSLIEIFNKVDSQYNDIKYAKNAISMKDIIHELGRVINRPELNEYISNRYKYLFCDEFQDSDNVQIRTIAALNRIYSGSLFVVGDIKQSIYRFRGATDSAFDRLRESLSEEESSRLVVMSLNKNYRTSKDILDKLDPLFDKWGTSGLKLLKYGESREQHDRLIPQVYERGFYKQILIQSYEREKRVMETVRFIMQNAKHNKIVFLARRNSQLKKIKEWCEKEKIVCLIRERGSFFKSDAVLDFCALVEAFLYDYEPMYLYNFIMSSYGTGSVDYKALSDCNGDKNIIFNILISEIDASEWEEDRQKLINRPVMSVLRELISKLNPTVNYGIRRKEELVRRSYPTEKAVNQAAIDASQYEANLKKLLQMLTNQFSGDFSSLLDICNFVRNGILTNNEEEPAEVENINEIEHVEGLTVHSAKGLEFENVLIPYMNDSFYQGFRSEILLSRDNRKVGWVYRNRNQDEIKNNQYEMLISEELEENAKEETRLLYVAMTRAMYGLYCFVERDGINVESPCSWADLMQGGK